MANTVEIYKNMDDASLGLWYGLCKLQENWKEEDRDEFYDDVVAEYKRRQQLDEELENADE